MKSEFLQPEFKGARFAEHTLPLEVAKDLAAYETLVVELAKSLYLQAHPDRQRVPKGFDSNFHLHLERVDPGSAKPLLALVVAGALALGDVEPDYFHRARDLVSACVAAPADRLPAEFPKELLSYFNQVGRSLRNGESMELPQPGGAPNAVLTPQRRKELVLAGDTVYERPVELSGVIVEINWEKSTFQLRQPDGSLSTIPMPESFRGEARRYSGLPQHLTTVKGVGTYDSWDRFHKLVSADSMDVQPNYQIANRLEELRSLTDGWYDGKGVALDSNQLDQVASYLIGHYPEKLDVPAIVPTPEGNLLMEWNVKGDPSVDIELATLRASFHAFLPNDHDLDQEFDLSQATQWQPFLAFLDRTLKTLQA